MHMYLLSFGYSHNIVYVSTQVDSQLLIIICRLQLGKRLVEEDTDEASPPNPTPTTTPSLGDHQVTFTIKKVLLLLKINHIIFFV